MGKMIKPLYEVQEMTLDEMEDYITYLTFHLRAVNIEYNYKKKKND